MQLSVVTTLYRSGGHLREFHRRMTAAATRVSEDYEMILVDDGSPDDSLAVARSIADADPHVVVVELSRNFGHHKAIMTGLMHARGRLVFAIDSDLEEEPEWLERFHAELRRTHADVVFGVQTRRKGGVFERVSGAAFYKLFNLLVDQPIPENFLTVRIMTRRYVRALVSHQEREVFLGALAVQAGFRQVPLPVVKHAHSPTTYTVRRRIAIVVNSITAFSNTPLAFIFYLGTVIVAVSCGAALLLVGRPLLLRERFPESAALIVSVWILGGLTIFCLGILGIYLAKVFSEVKRRPYTIVRAVHRRARRPVGDGLSVPRDVSADAAQPVAIHGPGRD